MRNSPISQIEIEQELLRFMDLLESETEAFEVLAVDAVRE